MTSGQTHNILVIDDEVALQELLTDALEDSDVKVTAAGSRSEAVQLAKTHPVDLVVTDLYLGDCTGLEVIDELRSGTDDLPAIVITGRGDAESFSEASRRQPIELMTKPLDLDRLRNTVRRELTRRADQQRRRQRSERLGKLAYAANRRRKSVRKRLNRTCASLTNSYRNLSAQMAMQTTILAYQKELLSARSDDDVFRALFRLFTRRSGPLFGVAMVCDENAHLNIIGRFGVPYPDSMSFCAALTEPLVDAVMTTPECMLVDAGDSSEMFDPSIAPYLPGLSALAIPLVPAAGEMIGMVTLYRKGEQPFLDGDVATAEMISTATAIAIRRND